MGNLAILYGAILTHHWQTSIVVLSDLTCLPFFLTNTRSFDTVWETMGESMRKIDIWNFFNEAKKVAVNILNFDEEQCIALKQECDSLFYQATGNPICPAWFISL